MRRKAHPVTRFDPELQTLVDDMIETMRQAPGVGLAAVQVGIPERVIVVEYADDDENEDSPKKLYVMVNPEIKSMSEETEEGIEGCLSMKVKAKGWMARIFQHEIDHINGVVFTDRATKVWKPQPEQANLDNV